MATYDDLSDKVVLVTGGASGIGAAHVRAFVASGARVAFIDRDIDSGRSLAAEIGDGGATFLPCDLNDPAAIEAAFEACRAELGPIFALVNNAAVDDRQPLEALGADAFATMMNANLRHVVLACTHAVPHMRTIGSGAIVNMSSTAWMRGVYNLSLYSAAKAGIVGFTNALARELGPARIRVNAIAPGYVGTDRQRSRWFDPAAETAAIARQCLPDAVEPADVADLAVFLCSDAARMVTAQCIKINGGAF